MNTGKKIMFYGGALVIGWSVGVALNMGMHIYKNPESYINPGSNPKPDLIDSIAKLCISIKKMISPKPKRGACKVCSNGVLEYEREEYEREEHEKNGKDIMMESINDLEI